MYKFLIVVYNVNHELQNCGSENYHEGPYELGDKLADQIERKQFDPNLQQALAWKRLETGTHTQDDVTWIKHECAERHHELKYGSGYDEAHNRAQTRFDGAPWD